jgi:hypothetical protein
VTDQLSVSVLAPMQFRFTDETDVKACGDRWYLYDESAIVRLPARRLVELEQATGHPVRAMMGALRQQEIIGDLLATWTGVHLVNPDAAGDFEAWAPVAFAIEWRAAVLDDLGKDDKPSPDIPDPTPTVALPSLPAAE